MIYIAHLANILQLPCNVSVANVQSKWIIGPELPRSACPSCTKSTRVSRVLSKKYASDSSSLAATPSSACSSHSSQQSQRGQSQNATMRTTILMQALGIDHPWVVQYEEGGRYIPPAGICCVVVFTFYSISFD
ncbi:hypothetical protein K503DRAFT_112757 [Rhizopogon vinicolor AM-OR11-026]|uniref:Uncharacterized protein n=1 Tax=Rhizopogon vinicolor AM-OR11-026 TaxID=1314800 RepID=A0A1B7MEY7_9AGAM|nr:hypothetical protein K503DRAFT_112757 [Rhizopogon vinicolor AM-OR11-026]